MKKRIYSVLAVAAAVCLLTACAAPAAQPQAGSEDAAAEAEEAAPAEEADAAEDQNIITITYISPDGWSIAYPSDLIEFAEVDEHTAQFVYTGECAGTCMVTVSYTEGKQPQELLYEVTHPWGHDDDLYRTEGFFPGTEDKWGFWRVLDPGTEGSGLGQTAIAGEYNGGVLLFEFTVHMSGDDAIDVPMSDTLSDLINGIKYDDFEPQTEYSYVPGRYVQEYTDDIGDDAVTVEYSITLNEDHTGTISLQDNVDILWGSIELTSTDGSAVYEYTIEGEELLLNLDGNWQTFTKAE